MHRKAPARYAMQIQPCILSINAHSLIKMEVLENAETDVRYWLVLWWAASRSAANTATNPSKWRDKSSVSWSWLCLSLFGVWVSQCFSFTLSLQTLHTHLPRQHPAGWQRADTWWDRERQLNRPTRWTRPAWMLGKHPPPLFGEPHR